MKLSTYTALISSIFLAQALFNPAPANAELLQLLEMHAGPSPLIDCEFQISVDQDNSLTGAAYSCSGEDLATYGVDQPQTMSLSQLRSGVVFMHHSFYDIDIIKVSGPNLDPRSGGTILIRYLKNAMLMSYGDFYAALEKIGDRWIAYTREDQGRRPISHMTVTTGLLGVKKIRAQ